MTITPFGDTEVLRAERPAPGPGQAREEVDRNQLRRLRAATVAAIDDKGYASCSVGDIIAVAGLSRSTFYRFFAGKDDCFRDTLDCLLAPFTEELRSRARVGKDQGRGRGVLFEILAGAAREHPDVARLCLIEAVAAGGAPLERVEAATEEAAMIFAMAPRPRKQKLRAEDLIEWALLDGLLWLLADRLRGGEAGDLDGLAAAFAGLADVIAPPLGTVPTPGRIRSRREAAPDRRPGTIQERIERSAISLVAERGYFDVRMAAIAAGARVSNSTLYSTFESQEEALEAGLFRAALELQARFLPAHRFAADRVAGLRAAVVAALDFLEVDPDLAVVLGAEIARGGERLLGACRPAVASAESLLAEDPDGGGKQAGLADEALLSTLYSLFRAQIKAAGPTALLTLVPLATYLLTAPSDGPAEAAASASLR